MTPEPIQAEAVVLRVVPYGDADLVVHLLVRGLGKVGAFARGARRSRKRFGGGLEPFCVVGAELAQRRGRELWDLRGSEPVEAHAALRGDLGRLAHAGYGTELVRELARDHEPNDPLLDVLVAFFRLLAELPPRSLLLRAFELSAMGAAGLAPVLGQCVRCGRDEGLEAFDARGGGVLCGACRVPGAMPVDGATLRLLRALQAAGMESGRADERLLPLEPARRLMQAFVASHVRHDLASLAFLRDVGAPE